MNSEDLDFILLEKFPELLTGEEKEDLNFAPNRSSTPDWPANFQSWLRDHRPNPEAMERREFESRPPALGLTLSLLDELHSHLQLPKLKAAQKRCIFKSLRGKMLRSLIPCSDCSTAEDLLGVLRDEITCGVPAPVPEWYSYSTVTMGPRKIGYSPCCRRGCFKTETIEARFHKCSQCELAVYCSRECQVQDWKDKHKKVCKQAKKNREQTKKVGKMMQMLSDASLTGQGLHGQDFGEMLANAATNPAVHQRRQELKAEKKRPKT
jgi:hypothetical protein